MRDYRKKFKLTPFETLSDLYELGVLDDTAYIQMQNAEEKRLNALKGKKKSKEVTVWEHSDDQFFYCGIYQQWCSLWYYMGRNGVRAI